MKNTGKRVKSLPLKQQKEALDRCYELVISVGNDSPDLVVALHDYIECINNNPTLDYIVDSVIQKEPKDILKKLETLEKKARKELDEVYNLIKKNLPKTLDPNVFLKSHFGDTYEDYTGGRVISSMGMLESCANVVESIIQKLWREPDGIKIIKKYVKNTFKENNGTEHISEIYISENLTRYREIQKELKAKEEIKPWGIFNQIYPSFLAIEVYTQNTKIIDELMKKDSYSPLFYHSAYESLLKDGSSLRGIKNFLISHYSKFNLTRLHNSILSVLDSLEILPLSLVSDQKDGGAKEISIPNKKIHTIIVIKPSRTNGSYYFEINRDNTKRKVVGRSLNIKKFFGSIVSHKPSIPYEEEIYKYMNAKNNVFFGDKRYDYKKLVMREGNELLKTNDVEWIPLTEPAYKREITRRSKTKN